MANSHHLKKKPSTNEKQKTQYKLSWKTENPVQTFQAIYSDITTAIAAE